MALGHFTRRRRFSGIRVCLVLLLTGLVLGFTALVRFGEPGIYFPAVAKLNPSAGDEDGDDLPDRLELELARKYAPIVLLAPGETAKPANVDWVLQRSKVDAHPADPDQPDLQPTSQARAGSSDPNDWITYVHVFPAQGGIHIQYWFYYGFNDGPLWFKHDSDWEHVTVKLDGRGQPLGAYYARHENKAPGRFFDWSKLSRQGDHPIVLSAKGTHASYVSPQEVPFYERGICPTTDLAATDKDCAVWKTWKGGGLKMMGERGLPPSGVAFMLFPGRWGSDGWLLGTAAPPGPAFQTSWCPGGDLCGP